MTSVFQFQCVAGRLDVDKFHTSARNFLDHDVIGDSGIFHPAQPFSVQSLAERR